MRYHANILENITNAYRSKDRELLRDIVFDEIATIIKENPKAIIEALKASNVTISDNADTKTLINYVAYAIVNNPMFQKNVAVVLAAQNEGRQPAREEFLNSKGGEASGGGKGGGSAISSIANAVSSIFNFATATQNLKSTEQQAKAVMYEKIFGQKKRINWLPIVAVAGVLLIGGIVVWRVTATK